MILRNVLDKATVAKIKKAVHDMQNQRFGRNGFEGTKTIRVMGLPGKHVVFDPLIAHPRVMELLDQVMLPNFLMLFCQTIEVHPGEKRQPIHHGMRRLQSGERTVFDVESTLSDDGFIRVPMPHQAFTAATLWCIGELRSLTERMYPTFLTHWLHRRVHRRERGDVPLPRLSQMGRRPSPRPRIRLHPRPHEPR